MASTSFEPYVAEPAEAPRRARLAHRTAALWTLIVLLLLISATTLFWVGRGEEDPALTVPSPNAQP